MHVHVVHVVHVARAVPHGRPALAAIKLAAADRVALGLAKALILAGGLAILACIGAGLIHGVGVAAVAWVVGRAHAGPVDNALAELRRRRGGRRRRVGSEGDAHGAARLQRVAGLIREAGPPDGVVPAVAVAVFHLEHALGRGRHAVHLIIGRAALDGVAHADAGERPRDLVRETALGDADSRFWPALVAIGARRGWRRRRRRRRARDGDERCSEARLVREAGRERKRALRPAWRRELGAVPAVAKRVLHRKGARGARGHAVHLIIGRAALDVAHADAGERPRDLVRVRACRDADGGLDPVLLLREEAGLR